MLAELRGHGSKLFGTSYPKTDVFIEASSAAGLLADIAAFRRAELREARVGG